MERVDVNEQIDLSGSWNDTTTRMVAEEMVNQILTGGWLTDFTSKNPGKKPVVMVISSIINHTNTSTQTLILKTLKKHSSIAEKCVLLKQVKKKS